MKRTAHAGKIRRGKYVPRKSRPHQCFLFCDAGGGLCRALSQAAPLSVAGPCSRPARRLASASLCPFSAIPPDELAMNGGLGGRGDSAGSVLPSKLMSRCFSMVSRVLTSAVVSAPAEVAPAIAVVALATSGG